MPPVHFVGTIGLDTAQDVFRIVGAKLKPHIKRIPDGEIAGRRLWVSWQYPLLRATPGLEAAEALNPFNRFAPVRGAEGVDASKIHFGELGYAREARASYLDFLAARGRGEIPATARFQVCLPTPLAVLTANCDLQTVAKIERPYLDAMLREVVALTSAIPHKDLALQWDVCMEMLWWDGRIPFLPPPFEGDVRAGIQQRLVAISNAVARDVELGYHFCYGDLAGGTIERPTEPSAMISLAEALIVAVSRPIHWFHMPVPLTATEAFFEPFPAFDRKGAELYFGVVQDVDGAEGARKRIAMASKHVSDFGISTPCGMGRSRDNARTERLLDDHAAAAAH